MEQTQEAQRCSGQNREREQAPHLWALSVFEGPVAFVGWGGL